MVLSPLHLLSAILGDDQGIVPMVLNRIGSNAGRIKEMAEGELDKHELLREIIDNKVLMIMPPEAIAPSPCSCLAMT